MLIVFCGLTVPEDVTVRTSVPSCTGAVTSVTGAVESMRQTTMAAMTSTAMTMPPINIGLVSRLRTGAVVGDRRCAVRGRRDQGVVVISDQRPESV